MPENKQLDPVALANLLSVLATVALQAYQQIQQNHAKQLATAQQVVDSALASAEANWDAVIAAAQAELKK